MDKITYPSLPAALKNYFGLDNKETITEFKAMKAAGTTEEWRKMFADAGIEISSETLPA